jgi:hypothetical protein
MQKCQKPYYYHLQSPEYHRVTSEAPLPKPTRSSWFDSRSHCHFDHCHLIGTNQSMSFITLQHWSDPSTRMKPTNKWIITVHCILLMHVKHTTYHDWCILPHPRLDLREGILSEPRNVNWTFLVHFGQICRNQSHGRSRCSWRVLWWFSND